jgi:CubicO group peptidase (beta-lactamase class C family)
MKHCARLALNAAVLCCAPLALAAGRAAEPPPLPATTPAAAGMSAARLELMSAHFRADVAQQIAAGYVLLVARDGKLVYASTIGLRDREHGLPMTLETRFRIMSMTKPITAVAVLMLYEEGRIQAADPVAQYLPEFGAARVYTGSDEQGAIQSEPAQRPITIRHLLTHTAGLGYGPLFDSTSPLGKLWSSLQVDLPEPLAEKIRALAKLPLYSQPGEEWRYSYSFDVLGRLVEVVSGMPFDQFLKTRLF